MLIKSAGASAVVCDGRGIAHTGPHALLQYFVRLWFISTFPIVLNFTNMPWKSPFKKRKCFSRDLECERVGKSTSGTPGLTVVAILISDFRRGHLRPNLANVLFQKPFNIVATGGSYLCSKQTAVLLLINLMLHCFEWLTGVNAGWTCTTCSYILLYIYII